MAGGIALVDAGFGALESPARPEAHLPGNLFNDGKNLASLHQRPLKASSLSCSGFGPLL